MTFEFSLERFPDGVNTTAPDHERIETVVIQTYTIGHRNLMEGFKFELKEGPDHRFERADTGSYVDKSQGDVPDRWEMRVPGSMLYHAQSIVIDLRRYLQAKDEHGLFEYEPSDELAHLFRS